MRHYMKSIIALTAMLLCTAGIKADPTVVFIMQLDGETIAAGTASPGTVDKRFEPGKCILTVTPAEGKYIEAGNISYVLTKGAQFAEVRRYTPGIDNTSRSVTATQPDADPTGPTEYFFLLEGDFDYEVTLDFQSLIDISNATVTLEEESFCYSGSETKPKVSSVLLNSTTINNSNYEVTYANNVNAAQATDATPPTVNVTATKLPYTGTATAKYTIAPKSVTITADNASKTYDGNPLTAGDFTATDLETGDTHTFTVVMTAASTLTNVGTQPNVIDMVDGVAVTTGTETAVGNYMVTTVDGTLTVTPITASVTITGHSSMAVYDGMAHSITGYNVTISNDLYKESDFSFSGTASASLTDAGTATMGLKADQFTNNNANFSTVTFTVTDGTLTISPKAVTVTADDKTKVAGEADPELTATVEGTVGNETVAYSLSRVKGEVAGEYDITVSGEATQGNYTVTFVNGAKLTITSKTYVVTAKNEWLTFSADMDVLMPDGLTAYTCKLDPTGTAVLYYEISEDQLKVDGQRVLKANNGVLLHGTANTTYTFTGIGGPHLNVDVDVNVKNAMSYGETQLIPVLTETHFDMGQIYVLSNNQFVGITESETKVPANRAVLLLPDGTQAARTLRLADSGATEIVDVDVDVDVNCWYTLDGRKFHSQPTRKGVYIRNGRKVVIR